jgi:hypothetical protein
MYSQLLKEILLDQPYGNQAKREFVDICQMQYAENDEKIKLITKFEEKYDSSLSIWWYTRDCFLLVF